MKKIIEQRVIKTLEELDDVMENVLSYNDLYKRFCEFTYTPEAPYYFSFYDKKDHERIAVQNTYIMLWDYCHIKLDSSLKIDYGEECAKIVLKHYWEIGLLENL